MTRAPSRVLLTVPEELHALAGPVFGGDAVGGGRRRPDPGPGGRAARRADHRHRPRARRRRAPSPERAARDLAGECGRPLRTRRRPASRAARPELHRRRPDADRGGRQLPVRHGQARRLPVAEPRERMAPRPHPLFRLRAGADAATRDADVLPGRPALRARSDLQLGPRPACPRPPRRPVRPADHGARAGTRVPLDIVLRSTPFET